MQHPIRWLLCLPGRRTNVANLLHRASLDVSSSCQAGPRNCLSVLNAARFRTLSRAFFHTWHRVTRSSARRAAIFAALRRLLLRPETPAKAVVSLLRGHFLGTDDFSISGLGQSERAVLIEILHKVLKEWSQWKRASSSKYFYPPRLVEFYAQYGVLKPQDWAFCINSLAWTAYEAFSSDLDEGMDDRFQRNADTFLLLRALLKTWKLFFYCHSQKRHDTYEVLNADRPGLWPLLHRSSVASVFGDYPSKFGLGLLSFIPKWPSDVESFAHQQLVCASMVSSAALCQSIEASTSISVCNPSTAINWEMSTISTSRSSGDECGITSSAHLTQSHQEAAHVSSGLTSDELSMLFVFAHAMNNQSINLTLLRVSLAKIVPENRIGQIMTTVSEFRSRAPSLLNYATLDQQHSDDLGDRAFAIPHVLTPGLAEPVRRDPVDALLERAIASRNISEVESLTQVFSSLKQRNPRLKLGVLEVAIHKKYLELGNPNQEREGQSTFPLVHTEKERWTPTLEFYFERNDITRFESAWAGLIAAKHTLSAGDWCKRLQLSFNCGCLDAAMEHFDALLRHSGRGQDDYLTGDRPPSAGIVTIDTFHIMIQNLLQYDELSRAIAVKGRLDLQQDIQADDTTYDLFFSYYMNRAKDRQAISYLPALAKASRSTESAPYFKLILHGLQRWPCTAPWADVHEVMEVFDLVLGEKYSESKVLRRISLVPTTSEMSFNIKVIPIPESDTLSHETKSMTAERLSEKVPTRADTSLPPATEALRKDLVLLMSAIANVYPSPRNVRMMLILWTYCVLQGIPNLQEIQNRLNEVLLQLPFRQQLRILGGDLYKRLSHVKYENFAYIRNYFGPEFAIRRLESLGHGDYGALIRRLPWRGFTSYNDQRLQDVGVTSEIARNLFLDDIKALHGDLKIIRKQEKSWHRRRMFTHEGIWYFRNEKVNKSGSLRKIPFEYWKRESRRQAMDRHIQSRKTGCHATN